jgi:hypothetical protein
MSYAWFCNFLSISVHNWLCWKAITRGECPRRRDQTTAAFIEKRGHRRKPLSDGWDRSSRDGDWGCAEHDWAGSEGIGAVRAVGTGSAAGSGTQADDFQEPALAKAGDPTLLADLEALGEPTTRWDPESPLRWTCKGVRRLAQALQAQGHRVSRILVGHLLNEAGYSLQGNRKTPNNVAPRCQQ